MDNIEGLFPIQVKDNNKLSDFTIIYGNPGNGTSQLSMMLNKDKSKVLYLYVKDNNIEYDNIEKVKIKNIRQFEDMIYNKKQKYDSIILDNASLVVDMYLYSYTKERGLNIPSMDVYVMLGQKLIEIQKKMKKGFKNVTWVCLEDHYENQMEGKLYFQPLLSGKTTAKLCSMADNVININYVGEQDNNSGIYYIFTVSNLYHNFLKNNRNYDNVISVNDLNDIFNNKEEE